MTRSQDTHSFASFTREARGEIAVLRFGPGPLFASTDFGNRESLFECLDQVAADRSVKVVVLFGHTAKTGVREYDDFFDEVAKQGSRLLARMLNVFNQYILKILALDKVVICANNGYVISQIMHASLACDRRIVADDTVFQNAYLKHGLPPAAGGAFFLTEMLGRKRAFELLLSDEDLTADEALDLGLVDKVVPREALEESTIDMARHLATKPTGTLCGIKRLLNFSMKDLNEYLNFETNETMRLKGRALFCFTADETVPPRAGLMGPA